MPYNNRWRAKTIYEGSVSRLHSKDTEKRPRSPLPVKRRRRKKPKKEPPIPVPFKEKDKVKKLDTKSKKYKDRMKDNEKYFKNVNKDYFLAHLLGLGYTLGETLKFL